MEGVQRRRHLIPGGADLHFLFPFFFPFFLFCFHVPTFVAIFPPPDTLGRCVPALALLFRYNGSGDEG